MTPIELLAVVESVASPASDLSEVAGRLGFQLAETRREGDVVEYSSEDVPGLRRVWAQETGAGFRVDLEPAAGMCVSWEDLRAQFGFAAKVPTHPGAPASDVEWWQYPQHTESRLSASFPADRTCAVTFRVVHSAP